uniref:putative Ig domain-containing protein n=1 Tax=Tropheryma whipplei TaxID=2039 RepID=UPI002408058F|nr:putative Ig domain-containing protein [Tropheryma whipplei]
MTPTTQGYITSYTVTNTDTTSGGANANGLPSGLSIDATKGTIKGSIDESVSTGLYKVTITATAPSYSSSTTLTSTTVTATYTILVTSVV